jgi:hypothetical protein
MTERFIKFTLLWYICVPVWQKERHSNDNVSLFWFWSSSSPDPFLSGSVLLGWRDISRHPSLSFADINGLNLFRSYVGPRPTLWFSCSRRFSWFLTLLNPIFLPPEYSPALIYFGRERGGWINCNYPTVLKEKNINRKSTTCVICWLKSALHGEKRRKQANRYPTLWFSCSRRFSSCSTVLDNR